MTVKPDQAASDASLVRRLRCGSEGAAQALYLRYAPRLRALARAKTSARLSRRVDADDIVQSVFRRFFQAAHRGNYDVPAGEDLWGLLLAITVNRIRTEETFQRAAKRDVRRTTGPPADDPALEGVLEHDEAAGTFLRLVVEEELGRLPAEYRQVVELRMAAYEVAEIARHLGRSKRTVERILQETRRHLRTLFEEDGRDHGPASRPDGPRSD
jgi:RNA polymerase sigma-70 factor, ECF subfamily